MVAEQWRTGAHLQINGELEHFIGVYQRELWPFLYVPLLVFNYSD